MTRTGDVKRSSVVNSRCANRPLPLAVSPPITNIPDEPSTPVPGPIILKVPSNPPSEVLDTKPELVHVNVLLAAELIALGPSADCDGEMVHVVPLPPVIVVPGLTPNPYTLCPIAGEPLTPEIVSVVPDEMVPVNVAA